MSSVRAQSIHVGSAARDLPAALLQASSCFLHAPKAVAVIEQVPGFRGVQYFSCFRGNQGYLAVSGLHLNSMSSFTMREGCYDCY